MNDSRRFDILIVIALLGVIGYVFWFAHKTNTEKVPPDLGPLPKTMEEMRDPPIVPCPVSDGCKG